MNIDLTKLDEPFVLENKTDEIVAIRHYRVNFVEKLLPGQTIEITPRFAEELAYYKKIQEDLETNSTTGFDVNKYVKIVNDRLKAEGWEYLQIGNLEFVEQMEQTVEYRIGNETIPETTYTVHIYNETNASEPTAVSFAIGDGYVVVIKDYESQTDTYKIEGNAVTNENHNNHIM